MKKGQALSPNILALLSNEPLMERVYQLMDSNLDQSAIQKNLRAQISYYFKLKEPHDGVKIEAIANAVNHITQNEQINDDVTLAIEKDLDENFNSENKDNFKHIMTNVEDNFKKMRPLPIPSVKAPALPTLPPEEVINRFKKDSKKRPLSPETVPRPAQYTEGLKETLDAIKKLEITPKFTVEAAASFIQSQRTTSKVAEKGYKIAVEKLGIENVFHQIEKSASKAIKKGDLNEVKNTISFIREVKEQLQVKKQQFDQQRDRSERMNLRGGGALAVLTLADEKISELAEKCKNFLASSENISSKRISRG